MHNLMAVNQDGLTMSSSQLSEMLGYERKEINKKIRAMFADKIAGEKISLALDRQNRVSEYHLPELESKMFVAKHNIEYLEVITQYWINKDKPKLPDFGNPAVAARAWADEVEAKQSAMIERDHAIATKQHINDKRTATLMNKASQDSKRIKKLEARLQDEGQYISLIAAGLPQRVDTELKDNVQTFRILKNISNDLEMPPRKVDDMRYGKVNTYHIDVIEQFKKEYL